MHTRPISIGYLTIARKETRRFLRIWKQTLLPSVITMTLYYVIFGTFIGSQINDVHGFSYIQFIVPGLIMMAVITNAFSNVASSFYGEKFQKSLEEMLTSPMPRWVIIAGFLTGGVLRGLMVGILVLLVSLFFTQLQIASPFFVFFFIILTSILFSLAGLINAVYARSFDDVSIIPTFVLTPLTYLGGVFYSIDLLPPIWQTVSLFNPILYLVNGFRYGFLGVSDVPVLTSSLVLIVCCAILLVINGWLFTRKVGKE